jgi:hypothetical protein
MNQKHSKTKAHKNTGNIATIHNDEAKQQQPYAKPKLQEQQNQKLKKPLTAV